MRYKIYLNGELVNTIVASESFVIGYCEKHGYTYEADPLPEPEPEPETPEEDVWAEMAAAITEGVNEV